MARYSGKKRMSESTREEGMGLARSTQRPGQTKEQTRLIAQGIQQGIDLYKKQQKAKARDLDRKRRQPQLTGEEELRGSPQDDPDLAASLPRRGVALPWTLLALTWVGIGVYLLVPGLRGLLAG